MITVKEVDDYVKTFEQQEDGAIKNGFVIKILQEKNVKSATEVVATLCKNPVNKGALTAKLRRLFTTFKKFRGYNLRIESNRRALRNLLNDMFIAPVIPTTFTPDPTELSVPTPSLQPCASSPLPTTSPTSVSALLHMTPTSVVGSLRGDCNRCEETRASGAAAVTALKRQLSATKSTLSAVKTTYQVKSINLFKKRKKEQIDSKKKRIKDLEKANGHLMAELDKVKRQCVQQKAEIFDLQKKVKSLEKNINKMHDQTKQIKELEKKTCHLERELEVSQAVDSFSSGSEIEVKVNRKTYNNDLRKSIYHCLCSQVPVESVGPVLEYVIKTLTGKRLSKTPDATTAAQMIIEMGVLSDLQLCEAVMKAPSVNLAWDATTVDGKHLNEIHINTPTESLTVTTQHIPGGTAADYAEQITKALSELSELHADFHGLDRNSVHITLKSKLLSTLTDRASANHATVVLLEEKLNIQLLELNCHLHPLDGLANSARALLKEHDRRDGKTSNSFGADCCVANVLYAVSKLRYKAKGDPATFKAFLKAKGKPCGTFIRYVGNRLHVFFHLAGTVVQHRGLLIEYLESYCNATALATAVRKDLKDEHIIMQLYAVGWMGKLVTGPWMALIYTPMLERKHLEMVKYIKVCMEQLSVLEECPETIFTSSTDVFGKPLMEDDLLQALRLYECSNTFLATVSALVSSFKTLLGRQLQRYLSGPLSEPDPNTTAQASAAPAHNIWAERCLGMIDAQIRRAPNATMTFVDAKVKCKTNHTLEWLDQKAPELQEALVSYAVKGAAQKRRREKQRMEEVNNIIASRMRERGQKKDMASRNKLGKAIKAAFAEGGVGIADAVFNGLSTEVRNILENTLQNKDHIVGNTIRHIWNVAGEDTVYLGRILSVRMKKEREISIGYWMEGQDEDEAVDSKLSWQEFVADILLGDLLFQDF